MSNQYFFNPKEVENFYRFSDFALSARGKKLVADMKDTPIGAYLIGFAEMIDPIIAFEEIPFFSLYVPNDINLDEQDENNPEGLEGSDVPALIFDIETANDRIFPFLVAGQLFRLLQDLSDPEESRILPMMQNSICYNPVARVDSKTIFTKDYAEMERACDVVALSVLHQMRQNGSDMQSFGYMRAQSDYQNICDAIAQTAAFTERSGVKEQDPELARDLLLYMGQMATRHSPDYDADIQQRALAAFDETMRNEGFEVVAQSEEQFSYGRDFDDDWDEDDEDWDEEFEDSIDFDDLDEEDKEEIRRQIREEFGDAVEIIEFGGEDYGEGYNPPPFNLYHYALVSDTYENRKWAGSRWIEIVNDYLEKENEDRAFRISEAFKMAAENKADREKENYLNGDAPKTDKPKGPKPPKK
jgi:hypothetical protein